MRQMLRPHPATPVLAVRQVDVEVTHSGNGGLNLSYGVDGDIDALRIPAVAAGGRGEELWRQTCFELFVGSSQSSGYYEFNFSPSRQWAAYWFTGYRTGMRVAAEVGAPVVEARRDADRFSLRASIDPARLKALPRAGAWRLGLSAIIEETGGGLSYWALSHPQGKPDFHHAVGFAHAFSPDIG
jgi:hypothetical protein